MATMVRVTLLGAVAILAQGCAPRAAAVRPGTGAGARTVSGIWETAFADTDGAPGATTLALVQGNRWVLGSYDAVEGWPGSGTLEGTFAEARVLEGTWQEGALSGTFRFTFSAALDRFDGEWRTGEVSGDWRGRAAPLPEGEAGALWQACAAGGGAACVRLGRLYAAGAEGRWDYALAAAAHRLACDAGDLDGCAGYADRCEDDATAVVLARRCCGAGHHGCCTLLGLLHDDGRGVARRPERARELTARACDAGHADGCAAAAVLAGCADCAPGEADSRELGLMQRACDLGSGAGCALLGARFLAGDAGLPRDVARGLELGRRACDDGEPLGCAVAAKALQERGDLGAARAAFERACVGDGLPMACRAAAGLRDADGDPTRAAFLLELGCASDRDSCLAAGRRHREGRGVERSEARAAALLRRACERGSSEACAELGGAGAPAPPDAAGVWRSESSVADRVVGMVLELRQRGRSVSGLYQPLPGHALLPGVLAGTLEGHVLKGTWTEEDEDGTLTTGTLALVFAEDWASFSGEWAVPGGGGGEWTGARARPQVEAGSGAPPQGRTCDEGDGGACLALANRLQDGDGVPRDPVRAEAVRARACQLGVKEACPDPSLAPRVWLDAGAFAPDETITVHFTAPSSFARDAWIGVMPASTPHGSEAVLDAADVELVHLARRTSGTVVLHAPGTPGAWDVRMSDTDQGGREVASVSFVVRSPAAETPSPTPPPPPGLVTRALPAAKVSLDHPADWTVREGGATVELADPRGVARVVARVTRARTLRAGLDEDWSPGDVDVQYLERLTDEPPLVEQHGMKAYRFHVRGADWSNAPMDFGVLIVQTPAKKILIVVGYAHAADWPAFAPIVEDLLASVKPL